MPAETRAQDFITTVRRYNRQIWEGIHELKALQDEWNSNAYGDNLPAGEKDNAGVTNGEVGAVVFASADALKATLDANGAGIAGNMAKLL